MRGKVGLVVGVAIGYVLGTRAGRERYEQIKEQALKVWDSEPVQKQVHKVEDFGKQAVMALPSAVWNGAVKVTEAITKPKAATPGQRLDAGISATKKAADDVESAAETSADAVDKATKKAVDDLSAKRATRPAARRPRSTSTDGHAPSDGN